jgi:hypothetical protein
MNISTQHSAAFALLDRTGISKINYAPLIVRLLWKFGVNIPPTHLMTFTGSAALTGTAFGMTLGFLNLLLAAATGTYRVELLLWIPIGAGVGFGLSMAAYYACGRRKHKLPGWSSLRIGQSND